MQDVETEMKTRVRKSGQNEDRTTGNMVWGEFVHFTSRPVNGIPDPHLHAHAFVQNVTFDAVEGVWKAGQFRDLKRDAPYFEALFHTRLAHRLTELGLVIERKGRRDWEFTGIPQSALEKFSRRTAEIEDKAKELGIEDAEAKSELGAKTRSRKATQRTMPELRAEWRSRLSTEEQDSLELVQEKLGHDLCRRDELAASRGVEFAVARLTAFKTLYADSEADVATWHFSRDRRKDDGWQPVYDCWEYADLAGFPPVSSNEPIGPGASVNVEREPIKLVMAAAFAYAAKAPMYLFHSAAGVHGNVRFEDMPGIDRYQPVLRLLPPDLPNWARYAAEDATAPFTTFAGGKPNRLWQEAEPTAEGCVRHCGSRQGSRFVSMPIGIQSGGLTLVARQDAEFATYHPLTGELLVQKSLQKSESITLPEGPGALLLIGTVHDGNDEN
jgi:hypothetical protein